MVHIPTITAQVRLFICCYADVPLMGNGSGLQHKSVPLWAILLAGKISVDRGTEYILGIPREPRLRATFSKNLSGLSSNSKEDFQSVLDEIPSSFARKVSKTIGTDSFIHKHIPRTQNSHMEYLYGAALLNVDDVRKMSFTIEEGFGIFLDEKNLKDILQENTAKEEMARKYFAKQNTRSFLPKAGVGLVIKIPTYRIKSNRLSMDLAGETNDLTFVCSALAQWKKGSEKLRRKQWFEAMHKVIG